MFIFEFRHVFCCKSIIVGIYIFIDIQNSQIWEICKDPHYLDYPNKQIPSLLSVSSSASVSPQSSDSSLTSIFDSYFVLVPSAELLSSSATTNIFL